MTNVLTAGHVATRDRYVDALRVGSLVVVILGHWLMGVVAADGQISNALVASPELQLATWVLQVMPLFFLVGGVAHAHALASLDRRGVAGPGRYATFVSARASRLLRPTVVLIGVWVAAGLVLRLFDATGPLVLTALRLVTQPLWFVGLYLGVAALAPAMLAAHRRWGGRVVVALVAAAVVVDLLRFGAEVPIVGLANFAFVWLALHQLGFCWYSRRLTRPVATALVVGGATVLIGCVSLGPYPVSMVGLPGDAISNMGPPTVALLAQGLALVGLAVLLRAPVTRALANRRVWTVVLVVGGAAMTAFLWHLTALFIGVVALRRIGLDQPAPATDAWWLTRPLWLLVLAALAVGLVAVFRRFDASRPQVRHSGGDGRAAVGAAVAVLGVLMVSAVGVDILATTPGRFIAVDVTPLAALTVLACAVALLPIGLFHRRLVQWTSRNRFF